MNIVQASKLLGVCPQTIRNRIARGEYRARKLGSRHAFELEITLQAYYTVRQLADQVGCSRLCIQKKIRQKIIKCEKHGNRYMIPWSEAGEFIVRRYLS